MQTYFSTFTAGANEIIERALAKRRGGHFKILLSLDGLLVYETSYSERDIRQLRFFNNSFLLITLYKELSRDPIAGMMKSELKNKKLESILYKTITKRTTFKIVTSVENRAVAADRKLLKALETRMQKNQFLSLSVRNPNTEFWFIARREGVGLFGLRITSPYGSPKKGELRSEIAHLLCLVSNPGPKDRVLDPFGGYGGIVFERAKAFPYKSITALEKDPRLVSQLKARTRKDKKSVAVYKVDELGWGSVADESVDAIITDPPWGMYDKLLVENLYRTMFGEAYRVLVPQGRMALLMGNERAFEEILDKNRRQWSVEEKHHILVSGKKAMIYKLVKK